MIKSAHSAIALAASKAITATDTSAAVNVGEYGGNGLLILNSSAGTGTTPTSTVKVQHSDDGSTGWTDFATFAAQTTAASLQYLLVNVNSLKKFARVVNTVGGTTPGYSYGVTLVGLKDNA